MTACADTAAAVLAPAPEAAAVLAPVPETIEALGLPPLMLMDIALRYLRSHGSGSIAQFRRSLKLSYPVAEALIEQLRAQSLVEVKSRSRVDLLFVLTESGERYATERSRSCSYAGPAPVPLEQYTRMVRAQRHFEPPTRDVLREAFAELVLPDAVIRRIGQAFLSGRPIFVYGPPGNGKTSVIERFGRVLRDSVLIPYAVEVDGQIVMLHDPWAHRPTREAETAPLDERWIRCHRPRVLAAGELAPQMLNLRLDESSGTYSAPVQMKANNGVLLIDDLGRQAIPPAELLNRWILPLDRHVDYLSLRYGLSFQIPFEMVIAFATNLDPESLADEAFLRRVPNKIYMEPVNDDGFDEIFRRVLARAGLPFDREISAWLRALCRTRNATGLRACYPRDLCEIVEAEARFEGWPVEVSCEALARAADTYFTRGQGGGEQSRDCGARHLV